MPWGPFLTWVAQILIIAMLVAIVVGLIIDARKKDQ